MKIDLTKPENFKKLTLEDLINDAVAREDVEALEWLKVQSNTMKTRKKEDGTTYEVRKSVVEYRPEYLKVFCKYQPVATPSKERAKQAKKDKAQRELDDKFAKAFAKLKK
jgi:hypothetical protein